MIFKHKICLFFIFFFYLTDAHAQEEKKITITKYAADTINQFDDESSITQTDLDNGFNLYLIRDVLKSAVVLKSNAGNFKDVLTAEKDTAKTYRRYHIKGPAVFDSVVYIALSRKPKDTVIIKLKISGEEQNLNSDRNTEKPCPQIAQLLTKEVCYVSDYKQNFGENVEFYDENTVVYVYDFNADAARRRVFKFTKNKSGTLERDIVNFNTEHLNAKSDAYFRVVNVNRFLYDIIFSDSVVHLSSDPNSLFSRLFIGDSNLMGGLLDVFTNDIKSTQGKTSELIVTVFERLSARIRCYLKSYNEIQARVLDAYNPCAGFPCCGPEITKIFSTLLDLLAEIQSDATIWQNLVKGKKEELKTVSDKIAACEKNKSDMEKFEKELKPLAEKKSPTAEESKKIEELKKAIGELKNNKDCQDPKALEKTQKELKEVVATYAAMDSLLVKLPSKQEISQALTTIANMTARNSQDLFPLNTDGNYTKISLQIKSRDTVFKTLSLPPYAGPVLKREIPVYNKSFISFSSGIFFGHPDYLKNKTYAWQKRANPGNVADTARYSLMEAGFTESPLGFAAFGNLEWKTSRNLGFGLSVGPGITIEKKPRPVYLLGVSAFFGSLRQFNLTVGVAGMNIDKLDANLEAVSTSQALYATPPAITYHKEFRTGAFLAFTYTPFTFITKK
jgi:hypothetical protein